jgi:conjugal transfer pilus assembly protein TraV
MKSIALKFILLLPLPLLISGCATTEYGCKGMPEDPKCLSTTEAYLLSDRALAEPARIDASSQGNEVTQVTTSSSISNVSGASAAATAPILQQPMPKIDDPTPIRTPAQVMRIWIAPWEDSEGDLMVSNYVYTELEPRRWMIGKSAPTISPTLVPLQVEQRAPEKHLDTEQSDGDMRGLQQAPLNATSKN